MHRINTKRMILNALMVALVFIATKLTTIPGPVPPGYINLGDAVIIIAAVLFGGRTGMIAGAIGSALADLASFAYIYIPITFIVKGLEGLIIGVISNKKGNSDNQKKNMFIVFLASIIGAFEMVAGYFVAEAYILGFIDKTLGFSAAVTSLPFNTAQGIVSVAVGYSLTLLLIKIDIKKRFNWY